MLTKTSTKYTPLNYETNVYIYAYAQPTPSKIQAKISKPYISNLPTPQ